MIYQEAPRAAYALGVLEVQTVHALHRVLDLSGARGHKVNYI